MKFSNDIQNSIYADYLKIPADYYQDKIRFFENNVRKLGVLPHDIFLMIKIDYVRSLFRVRDYKQFLFFIDEVLESIIIDNPSIPGAKQIFCNLLLKKGRALHINMEFEKAEHVFVELVKIEPGGYHKRFYINNHRDKLRHLNHNSRGLIIGLILLSGFIIGVELLVVRTLFPEHTNWVEAIRNISFAAAILLFIGQEIYFIHHAFQFLKKKNRKI